MHYLVKTVQSSWQSIKQNKLLFLLVIFLEIIFLTSFLYMGISDHLKIIENAQNVIEPIQKANFDAESIQAGKFFLKEFDSIEKSAQQMKEGLILMLGKLFMIFLFLNGLIWILINKIIKNKIKIKQLLKSWFKFITSSVILLGILYLTIKIIIKSHFTIEFTEKDFKDMAILIGLTTTAVYYLLTVCFAFIDIESWKEFIKNIFQVGILKINQTGVIALINMAFLISCSYLLYLSTNNISYSWLLLPATILTILVLPLTKIYWIINLQQIAQMKK